LLIELRELFMLPGLFDRFMVELGGRFMFPGAPVLPVVVPGLPMVAGFVLPPMVVPFGLVPIPFEGRVFVIGARFGGAL
jgi:hypothetical protein